MKITNTGKNEFTVYAPSGRPMGTYPTLLEANKRVGDINHYMVSQDKKENDRKKLNNEFGIDLSK